MIVVNLEKYSDDGYKKSANSLNADAPDNILAVRFYYNDFLANNYIQATFVDGNTSAVQYDPTTVAFVKFKMFVSTDEINYTEVVSYGGDDGQDVTNQGLILDPGDFSDNEIMVKKTIGNVEQFVPISLQTLADEIELETAEGSATGTVDYWYVRGILTQQDSDPPFFGKAVLNSSTGFYSFVELAPEQNVAGAYDPGYTSRLDTGVYTVPFLRPDLLDFGFITELLGDYRKRWETRVIPVYGTSTKVNNAGVWYEYYNDDLAGYLVLQVESYFEGLVTGVPQFTDYYALGTLVIKTYDADFVPSDDIIRRGITIEFRAYPDMEVN